LEKENEKVQRRCRAGLMPIAQKTIYLISGLGADERAFAKLDFKNHNVIFIPWISPIKNEAIEDYARRMAEKISIPNPIIIGLSFGGMIAVEIAKQIKTSKVLLISSCKTRSELPFYFKAFGRSGLLKLLPSENIPKPKGLDSFIMGAENSATKEMVKDFLLKTDSSYLYWAMNTICNWQNTIVPPNTYHIHGSADLTLPFRFVKNAIEIKGGKHLMIINRSEEVNLWISNILN